MLSNIKLFLKEGINEHFLPKHITRQRAKTKPPPLSQKTHTSVSHALK